MPSRLPPSAAQLEAWRYGRATIHQMQTIRRLSTLAARGGCSPTCIPPHVTSMVIYARRAHAAWLHTEVERGLTPSVGVFDSPLLSK